MNFFIPAARPYMHHKLWCKFRKQRMLSWRLVCNFWCKALYNLPWRASVSSHQVQRKIPAFDTSLWKNVYLFLERCRKSNNGWLRFDAVRLFIFVFILWTLQPHFTLWLSALTIQLLFVCLLVCLFEGMCVTQHIRTFPGLDQGWTQCLTLDVQ